MLLSVQLQLLHQKEYDGRQLDQQGLQNWQWIDIFLLCIHAVSNIVVCSHIQRLFANVYLTYLYTLRSSRFFIGGFFLFCSPKPDPGCCGSKDNDKKDEENAKEKAAADEKPTANEEEKPNEEDTTVVAAAAVVNEEKEEEKKKVEEAKSETNEEAKDEEQPDEPAQSTVEAVPVPVPVPVEEKVDDNPDDEPIVPDTPVEDEEPEEPPTKDVEDPAVVHIPVPLSNEPERGLTPPPEDLSMEIEYDEEFGTSINRGWAEQRESTILAII